MTRERRERATHSIPRFEGPDSRRHRDAGLLELRLRAARGRLGGGGGARGIESLVQFVGFPRSGHSLIGSLLDAHPAATIAHELDLMGLVAKGFAQPDLFALIRENARDFTRHGRWWNGFAYAVDGAPEERRATTVLGDKKGDWAVRRFLEDPGVLARLEAAIAPRCRWILVTRDPFDNIATLSLRRGGAYDRLRIAHAGGRPGFRDALAAAQARGEVATEASDEMIDDYGALCDGVERMRAAIDAADWHHVVYESFTGAPRDELAALLGFCGLDADPGFVEAATRLVKPGSRSRSSVAWSEAQVERVEALIERHPFLSAYAR